MTPRMTCDFNALRRNLAAAYNRHVDEINLTAPRPTWSSPRNTCDRDRYTDMAIKESCAEVGNGVAALLALSSDDGIADLSDAVTLRIPFGEDEQP